MCTDETGFGWVVATPTQHAYHWYMTQNPLAYNTGRDLEIDTCDRLRLARLKAGIEQEEMAEILGVSSSTISNWECGRTAPKAAFVAAWARVTGFNTASLVGDADRHLLAGTPKREKLLACENADQQHILLPRMDSNHQPCDWTGTAKYTLISAFKAAQTSSDRLSCLDKWYKTGLNHQPTPQVVCWTAPQTWNTVDLAGQS